MAKQKSTATGNLPLSEVIRREIAARDLTPYSVAKASEVDPAGVTRFLKRERTLSLDSAERIAAALGIECKPGRGGLR
jgi:plasmid maintenance system antidote protein VapI